MGNAQGLARTHDVLSIFIQYLTHDLEQHAGHGMRACKERPIIWPYTMSDHVTVIYDPTRRHKSDPKDALAPHTKLISAHEVDGKIECYLHQRELLPSLERTLQGFTALHRTQVFLSIDAELQRSSASNVKHCMEYHIKKFFP